MFDAQTRDVSNVQHTNESGGGDETADVWGEVPSIGSVLAYLVNLDVWCEEGVRVSYEGPVRAGRSAAAVLLGVEGDPKLERHSLGISDSEEGSLG